MKEKIKFPENFWWGAATSGPQTEGWFNKRHENVMDYWYRTQRNDFFDHVGPDVASDFYHKYPEDLKMMASIGMNSFRTSIQWSRLIKDLETGEVDEDAVAFYKDVIKQAKENGLEPVMNLHHFDIPVDLYNAYGGWTSRKVVDLYVDFAKKCFELFGDEVKFWTTFNEPMVIAEMGYIEGAHFPKLKNDFKDAVQVIYNLNIASAKAIQAFHEMVPDGQIGIILNLTPSYPRSDSKEDKAAAAFADAFFNESFLDPAVKGHFPKLLVDVLEKDHMMWKSEPGDKEIIENNRVDFLGVNYYQPKRVKAPEKTDFEEWNMHKYFSNYKMLGARMNPYRGWEIYPQAIYDIAKNVQNNYGNIKWFISENGMGVEGEEKYRDESGKIDDQYRIDFYEEHLAWLAKAIEEGSNCFGYHAWTPFDCWSWNNAYKNRYGFIGIDLNDQKRTIKESGYWLKKVSDNNGFEYDWQALDDKEQRR